MKVSEKITQRVKEAGAKYWASDNVAEFMDEGDDQALIEELVEHFEKVLDYKENFRKKGNYFIWYNVKFNTKTLKLYIGNQEEHFAECKSVEGTFELNKLLEFFLTNKKNNNTIQISKKEYIPVWVHKFMESGKYNFQILPSASHHYNENYFSNIEDYQKMKNSNNSP